MALRKHGTLVANTVATVQVGNAPAVGRRREVEAVEVVSVAGSDPVYFTVSGDTPAIMGDDTYVCAAGGSVQVTVGRQAPVTVKLVSAGVGVYSVEAL